MSLQLILPLEYLRIWDTHWGHAWKCSSSSLICLVSTFTSSEESPSIIALGLPHLGFVSLRFRSRYSVLDCGKLSSISGDVCYLHEQIESALSGSRPYYQALTTQYNPG